MTDVSIIIPTFGDLDVWGPLADRAQASAEAQTVEAEVIRVHGDTLAKARNDGGCRAEGKTLIFLDGDDQLDERYVEAMLAGTTVLRQPATLGVVDGIEDDFPVVILTRPLLDANYLVIGTMVPRDLFIHVGGFSELEIFDDWDLWLRCWLEGATIGSVPDAIYRVHVRPGSRNTGAQYQRVYNEIRQRYLPVAQARGLV